MSGFYEFNHVNIKHKNDFEPFTESDLMVSSWVVVLGNDEIPELINILGLWLLWISYGQKYLSMRTRSPTMLFQRSSRFSTKATDTKRLYLHQRSNKFNQMILLKLFYLNTVIYKNQATKSTVSFLSSTAKNRKQLEQATLMRFTH